MERVTLYLRTPLFTLGASGHLPEGVSIVDGDLVESRSGGWVVDTLAAYTDTGKLLSEAHLRLFIPLSKLDHASLPGT